MDEEEDYSDPRRTRTRGSKSKLSPALAAPSSRTKAPHGAAAQQILEHTRFWGTFLDDPVTARASPKFLKCVWMGLPDDFGLRRQIWPSLCSKIAEIPKLASKLEKDKLNPGVLEHIDIELSHEGCFRVVGDVKVEKDLVEKLVVALHLSTNQVSTFIAGSVQLAALMLNVCDNHLQEAFRVLTALFQIMDEYFVNNYVQLRSDCLLVADIIARDLREVSNVFNNLRFDVVDYSDLVHLWAVPIFVAVFPKEFVLRTLDLIFCEGTFVIPNILYGIIWAFQDELLLVEDFSKLYSFMHSIPEILSKNKLDRIFKVGFDLFLNFSSLRDLRSSKDWLGVIQKPGVPTFVIDVGGDGRFPKTELESRLSVSKVSSSSIPKFDPSALKSDSDSDENERRVDTFSRQISSIEIRKEDIDVLPKHLAEKVQKVVNDSYILKGQIDEVQKDLRDRAYRINRLENELERMEARLQGNVDLSSPSISTVKSKVPQLDKFINEKRALEYGVLDLSREDRKVADEEFKYDSFQLNDFKYLFSTVYEQLSFPCVCMEGYLSKLSKATLFGGRQLNKRWFILKGRFLTYFKSHLHSKPQKDRVADVLGWKVVTITNHSKGSFAFELSGPGAAYLLFADDGKELSQWLIALRAAVLG